LESGDESNKISVALAIGMLSLKVDNPYSDSLYTRGWIEDGPETLETFNQYTLLEMWQLHNTTI
jgi:hypothetical protein